MSRSSRLSGTGAACRPGARDRRLPGNYRRRGDSRRRNQGAEDGGGRGWHSGNGAGPDRTVPVAWIPCGGGILGLFPVDDDDAVESDRLRRTNRCRFRRGRRGRRRAEGRADRGLLWTDGGADRGHQRALGDIVPRFGGPTVLPVRRLHTQVPLSDGDRCLRAACRERHGREPHHQENRSLAHGPSPPSWHGCRAAVRLGHDLQHAGWRSVDLDTRFGAPCRCRRRRQPDRGGTDRRPDAATALREAQRTRLGRGAPTDGRHRRLSGARSSCFADAFNSACVTRLSDRNRERTDRWRWTP